MKKQRTIIIPDDLDEFIETTSKEDLRTYTKQVEHLLRKAQKEIMETNRIMNSDTQIDPTEFQEAAE